MYYKILCKSRGIQRTRTQNRLCLASYCIFSTILSNGKELVKDCIGVYHMQLNLKMPPASDWLIFLPRFQVCYAKYKEQNTKNAGNLTWKLSWERNEDRIKGTL